MQAPVMQLVHTPAVHRRHTRRRRQRLFRRLVVVLLLAIAMVLVIPKAVSTMARSEAPAVATYTVAPGDTLWAIADQYNKGGDVRRLITAIKQANHMTTATVQPGQVLVVPLIQ
ncbi:MAG TPA: LysM peptidoglycan-binding domain-containing protein [Symbiobacteriaceae bacterium]|jgi:LysM repeat protein|nr:LysM peptidoglycan-binding domain-containing protein [Symbiobacteriaceae bacterium]